MRSIDKCDVPDVKVWGDSDSYFYAYTLYVVLVINWVYVSRISRKMRGRV